ncbi:XdhC family protein [soil metagenome]
MMPAALSRRARELAAAGVAFVTATVVRVERPTSTEAGDAALVLGDGTIEGFVGGSCAEHSVRAYSLEAIERGEPVLLRILPFEEEEPRSGARRAPSSVRSSPDRGSSCAPPADVPAALLLEVAGEAREDGAVTVQNPCLSGGAIELFLEPVLPAPRVLVVGETPIARAVLAIGPELGLDVVAVGGAPDLRPDDLALVVAAHGQDELDALRAGLEAGLPYVGLVASPKRGAGVIGELRGDGVPGKLVERIDVPAGLDIGARTPAEIALSILAAVVAVRRERRSAGSKRAGASATDPICGMTVAAVASTPSVEHGGETAYFCCEGCKAEFERRHEHAVAE